MQTTHDNELYYQRVLFVRSICVCEDTSFEWWIGSSGPLIIYVLGKTGEKLTDFVDNFAGLIDNVVMMHKVCLKVVILPITPDSRNLRCKISSMSHTWLAFIHPADFPKLPGMELLYLKYYMFVAIHYYKYFGHRTW